MTAALAFTFDRLLVGGLGGLVVRWLEQMSYMRSRYSDYGINTMSTASCIAC